MATLLLSAGVPMLTAGDELCRTQGGNNNAYCQDNEISWIDWTLTPERREFLEFTRRIIRIWKDHSVLRRRKFYQGRRIRGAEVIDIAWLDPSGAEMTDDMWNSPEVRGLGVRLNGDAIQEVNERGERIVADTLLVIFNAGDQPLSFVLPPTAPIERWDTLVDTADPWQQPRRLLAGDRYDLPGRAVAVLKLNGRKDDVKRSTDWSPHGGV
jgi:glycogen operon protein